MPRSPASSDDEAPEVVSFQSEKKAAKDRANAHQQFQTQEKEKRKIKNRRIDQALKEHASLKKKQKVVDFGSGDESEEEESGVGGSHSSDDLEARIGISFHDAAKGVKRSVTINPVVDCSTCTGTGLKPGTKRQSCNACGGTGTRTFVIDSGFQMASTCNSCQGTGSTIPRGGQCSDCAGMGKVRTRKLVMVDIPAGEPK